ncbi:major capsid protein P2 [Enterovibrio norvegicus]|uniref:major capsid protein P2 n=1 Tax=Enterovibrio norvegicus TaxID=188144 RepID=UPI0035541C61
MQILLTPFAPRPKELDPIEGVGWGQRAALRLVSGPTYHKLELVTNITNPADIERVEVTLNGSAVWSVSGDTLVKMQHHGKHFAEEGRYVLNFGDNKHRTKIGVRQGDLVTLQGEIWFVYIQLKAKNGAAAPDMRARAKVLPSQDERFYLPRVYELTWHASSTGRTPFDWAERSPFLNIKRIHFKDASVERVRILRDRVEEFNSRKVDNAFDLAESEREQNPDWFSVDFTQDGFGADGMLNTAAREQLQFELDKTQTGSVPVIVEALEQVKALPSMGA